MAYSGQVLQPSAGSSDAMTSNKQGGEGVLESQYNSISERQIEKDSFLPNGPSIMPNEVSTSHLHHSTGSNSTYYMTHDKPTAKFTESKLLPPSQENQLKPPADNLGMGQTTFGANEAKYNVDMPPSSQYSGTTLHSVDAYQQQSSDIARIKVHYLFVICIFNDHSCSVTADVSNPCCNIFFATLVICLLTWQKIMQVQS